MSNNLEVVQTFFRLAVEGKIEEAMDLIHRDCKWIYFGPREQIPWAGKVYEGPEGMADYMADTSQAVEIISFEPTFYDCGDTIFVRALESNKGRTTGKSLEMDLIQMLEISGGKIIAFREYADTIKMAGIVG